MISMFYYARLVTMVKNLLTRVGDTRESNSDPIYF